MYLFPSFDILFFLSLYLFSFFSFLSFSCFLFYISFFVYLSFLLKQSLFITFSLSFYYCLFLLLKSAERLTQSFWAMLYLGPSINIMIYILFHFPFVPLLLCVRLWIPLSLCPYSFNTFNRFLLYVQKVLVHFI